MLFSAPFRKFLKWLFPFAFTIGGVINLSNDVSLTGEVGSTASSFLVAHGITQPILGVVLLTGGMILFAIHVERAKKPIQVIDSGSQKALKKLQALEKKHGANYLDRIDATLTSLNQLGSKKN